MKIEEIVKSKKCSGCLSCFIGCPANAISVVQNDGYFMPTIDKQKCIGCRLCDSKCHILSETQSDHKKETYIGKDIKDDLLSGTSSGGVASCISRHFISEGGVVYGAKLIKDNNKIRCEHQRASSLGELECFKGSKYIYSDISDSLKKVKNDLSEGKKVLFLGCSCQIASIKLFVGQKLLKNLFTIDLICHGIPTYSIFDDYITFLENKYRCSINKVSFRNKNSSPLKHKANYRFSFEYQKNGRVFKRSIKLKNSSFYRMFMERAGYRECCYTCKYASLNRPGDLTLGDSYMPNEFFSKRDNISFVMVNTSKGSDLIRNEDLILKQINVDGAISHHQQLQRPSKITNLGSKLIQKYRKNGIKGIERYILLRNIILFIPSIIKKIFVRN